jgi:hypothetical protein
MSTDDTQQEQNVVDMNPSPNPPVGAQLESTLKYAVKTRVAALLQFARNRSLDHLTKPLRSLREGLLRSLLLIPEIVDAVRATWREMGPTEYRVVVEYGAARRRLAIDFDEARAEARAVDESERAAAAQQNAGKAT